MKDKKCGCRPLSPVAFGLAAGVIWAVALFVAAIIHMIGGTAYGAGMVTSLSHVYIGYSATFGGAVIGALWGFFDIGIGFLVFAWLYNCFSGANRKTCGCAGGKKTNVGCCQQ
jgi:hypothetical protein